MPAGVTLADHERLIKRFAYRVWRRMSAAGARGFLIEDVMQELNVAWVMAFNSYDPAANVPFGAYLMRGMKQHINRWAQKEIDHGLWAPASLDATFDGEHSDTLHSVVPATAPSAAELLAEQQHRAKISNRLSPIARQVLELVESPPQILVDEFRALQAKRDWGRQRGYNTVVSTRITTCMVMDLLGLNERQRRDVYAEFRKIIAFSNKVNQ